MQNAVRRLITNLAHLFWTMDMGNYGCSRTFLRPIHALPPPPPSAKWIGRLSSYYWAGGCESALRKSWLMSSRLGFVPMHWSVFHWFYVPCHCPAERCQEDIECNACPSVSPSTSSISHTSGFNTIKKKLTYGNRWGHEPGYLVWFWMSILALFLIVCKELGVVPPSWGLLWHWQTGRSA